MKKMLVAFVAFFLLILEKLLAEIIIVVNNDAYLPCSGCSKTNNFLLALENGLKSQENTSILIEDPVITLDSNMINAFLEANEARSPYFTERLNDADRDLVIRGRENLNSEIVINERPISLSLNRIRLKIMNIVLTFQNTFSDQMDAFSCFFCFEAFNGSFHLLNSTIKSMAYQLNPLWNPSQNYSMILVKGKTFSLTLEDSVIENYENEVFKNFIVAFSSFENEYPTERKIIFRNLQILVATNLSIFQSYFTNVYLEMDNVSINNIKIVEINAFQSSILELKNLNLFHLAPCTPGLQTHSNVLTKNL